MSLGSKTPTNLGSKIPVEQLDDDRLINIERRIVAGAADQLASPAPARSIAGFAAGLVAVAAAAGVVGYLVHRPKPGQSLAEKVAIATTEKQAKLDIGDATIESSPGTQFVVTRPDGGVLVDMDHGRVELEVGKRGNRPPLIVRAGDTDVVVVGTHFIVAYDGHAAPTVTVTEGVVRVVRTSESEVRIAAGHAWAPEQGLVAIAERSTEVAAETTGPEVSGAGSGSAVAIDTSHPPELRDHVAAVPDTRLPVANAGSGSNVAIAGGPSLTSRPKTIDPVTDPKLDLKTMIRQEPVPSPVDVHEVDPASAVAKYREMLRTALTREDGDRRAAEESQAYYGIAYMQQLRLGRSADALSTTENYLRRFSTSRHPKEYAAILWLRVRIACLGPGGIDEKCRQAAETYARLADGGPERTANVARLIGE